MKRIGTEMRGNRIGHLCKANTRCAQCRVVEPCAVVAHVDETGHDGYACAHGGESSDLIGAVQHRVDQCRMNRLDDRAKLSDSTDEPGLCEDSYVETIAAQPPLDAL